jgi:hypothetical protein
MHLGFHLAMRPFGMRHTLLLETPNCSPISRTVLPKGQLGHFGQEIEYHSRHEVGWVGVDTLADGDEKE